ncbi:MAG TPA: hypothetical protein VFT57_17415 [Gemmatimonadaceae bacterium]|nr:hypothetical protein [Gemmatimonadaceae bacterium]
MKARHTAGHTAPRTASLTLCAAALTVLLAACATGGGQGGEGARRGGAQQQQQRPEENWPIKTRYQLDLWLHGYAMVQQDTTLVPYFERGYRDRIKAAKNRTNTYTDLDRYASQLRAQMGSSQTIVGGQFLPLYFDSWDEMRAAIDTFLVAKGNMQATQNPMAQRMIAVFASSYATAADRQWLETFVKALDDENQRFYQSYWNQQQRERSGVMVALDSLWPKVYLPKFREYLNNTRQNDGEILVSLPLDGEGRTITSSPSSNSVAVTFPEKEADALDAIYVFTHEVVGTLAAQVIADNTTPAEKQNGVAAGYASPAAVRGGVIVLKRIAPELVAGYERYYLRSANASFTPGTEEATMARVFPLPQSILYGMTRQLEIVFGGI